MGGFMKKIVVMCIVAVSLLAACDNQKEENSSNLLPLLLGGGGGEGHDWTLMSGVNTDAPSSTVKLVFVHHSTGSAWIETGTGNLGQELNANNYWVAESDYGWGPTVAPYGDAIGSHTDTVDWPNWFGSSTVMSALYASTHHEDFTNSTSMSDPGGENTIIMFKSCFPNSEVGDSIDDEKAIYNGLLPYFAAHTDKMFMLIVPPPEIVISSAVLTRELADWLVAADGWLSGYTGGNVYALRLLQRAHGPEQPSPGRGDRVEKREAHSHGHSGTASAPERAVLSHRRQPSLRCGPPEGDRRVRAVP